MLRGISTEAGDAEDVDAPELLELDEADLGEQSPATGGRAAASRTKKADMGERDKCTWRAASELREHLGVRRVGECRR